MSEPTLLDAEDIAIGNPLSGPDELTDRIFDAMSEMFDAGVDEGTEYGYEVAIADIEAELELDGNAPKFDYEERSRALKWICDAMKEKITEAHADGYNEALGDVEVKLQTMGKDVD